MNIWEVREIGRVRWNCGEFETVLLGKPDGRPRNVETPLCQHVHDVEIERECLEHGMVG